MVVGTVRGICRTLRASTALVGPGSVCRLAVLVLGRVMIIFVGLSFRQSMSLGILTYVNIDMVSGRT